MEFINVEDTSSCGQNVPLAGSGLQTELNSVNDTAENFDEELGVINPTVIKIIGCGGGGSNAVQRMIEDGVSDVQFIVLNTDKQALHKSTAQLRVPIGQKITGGLGAGGNPIVGENAAKEDSERLSKVISGADMVVITAGMGGGTGTGSAPVVAQLSHDAGILTIAVVTTPFTFEGKVRMDNALAGLEKLRQNVDSLIVLPNDLIFKAVESIDRKMTFKEQFKLADALLCSGVKGVTELITKPGDVNLDFADVSTIMRGSGDSILGVGTGKGENRINEAVEGAIANPLLENRQIDGAKKILINITSNGNLALEEAQEIVNLIRRSANPSANIIFGLAENQDMEDDDISVTVIATDFDSDNEFAHSAPAAEEENDDSIADYGDFIRAMGGKDESESKVEKVPGHFSALNFKNEPADSADTKTEPAASSVPLSERGTVSLTENSGEENSSSVKRSFLGHEIPPGTDPNDMSQPAIYRKRQRLSRSIDLTQL
ncbi:cell division protein FtsZ [Treponema sp.]|uniref:cell division protein FtsZ n=1 Tax=Treponema sp. TaxID=166 RepID=UPI003F0BAD9E